MNKIMQQNHSVLIKNLHRYWGLIFHSLIIVCSESLPYASTRVQCTRAAVSAHSLEFKVSRCRTSKFARCFLPAQVCTWNDLPYTMFTLGHRIGLRQQLTVCCGAELYFFQFSVAQMLVGLEKQFSVQTILFFSGLHLWFK